VAVEVDSGLGFVTEVCVNIYYNLISVTIFKNRFPPSK